MLRNRSGEVLGYAAVRMILMMIVNAVQQAAWTSKEQLEAAISSAKGTVHRLTGFSVSTISDRWAHWREHEEVLLGDASRRGSASENVTIEDLRQLSPAHYKEVEKFIDTCNSKAGPGKVTLNEIRKHMRESAPNALRCNIPRSSLSYMLRKHMGFEYAYTKKKGTFMAGEKRHARIRKFVIEMNRALQKQADGTHVIVFTDETYIHQNHSPLMSWVRKSDHGVEKTSSKGKRLIVLHAITTDGFVLMRDADNKPIEEFAIDGDMSPLPTAEWIWEVRLIESKPVPEIHPSSRVVRYLRRPRRRRATTMTIWTGLCLRNGSRCASSPRLRRSSQGRK